MRRLAQAWVLVLPPAAGCVQAPPVVTVLAPEGDVIATVDTRTGVVQLTPAAYGALARALRAVPPPR